MDDVSQIKESVFISTLVWAWAIHHMPMFDGGIHISLGISVLTYPVAVLAAYLAVYKRQIIATAVLLLISVVLAFLAFHYTLPHIAESLAYVAGTGILYAVGVRYMVRFMKQRRP